jgi:hypothetical protein
MVPVRGLLPLFAVTEYRTVPLPLPDAPSVIVIQLAFETAVHVQPVPAVTLIAGGVCALSLMLRLVGLIEYVQPVVCVTVWV